jgi:hypothetical protein
MTGTSLLHPRLAQAYSSFAAALSLPRRRRRGKSGAPLLFPEFLAKALIDGLAVSCRAPLLLSRVYYRDPARDHLRNLAIDATLLDPFTPKVREARAIHFYTLNFYPNLFKVNLFKALEW